MIRRPPRSTSTNTPFPYPTRFRSFDALVDYCRSRAAEASGPLLVEGVGGAMVPLGACHNVLDWIAALGFPALLVSGTYLGAISHALKTLAALEARGVEVAAIVLRTSLGNPVPPEETRDTLARFTHVPIRLVPRLAIGRAGWPAVGVGAATG